MPRCHHPLMNGTHLYISISWCLPVIILTWTELLYIFQYHGASLSSSSHERNYFIHFNIMVPRYHHPIMNGTTLYISISWCLAVIILSWTELLYTCQYHGASVSSSSHERNYFIHINITVTRCHHPIMNGTTLYVSISRCLAVIILSWTELLYTYQYHGASLSSSYQDRNYFIHVNIMVPRCHHPLMNGTTSYISISWCLAVIILSWTELLYTYQYHGASLSSSYHERNYFIHINIMVPRCHHPIMNGTTLYISISWCLAVIILSWTELLYTCQYHGASLSSSSHERNYFIHINIMVPRCHHPIMNGTTLYISISWCLAVIILSWTELLYTYQYHGASLSSSSHERNYFIHVNIMVPCCHHPLMNGTTLYISISRWLAVVILSWKELLNKHQYHGASLSPSSHERNYFININIMMPRCHHTLMNTTILCLSISWCIIPRVQFMLFTGMSHQC